MKRVLISSLLWAVIACGTSAHAQVPQLLHYQGRISVHSTNFHGTGQFKFALVSGAGDETYWSHDGTSSGGSEPATAIELPVVKGLYSVLLGDTNWPGMSALPVTVFTNSDVRLRVWFNDGTTGFELLTPDQRIAAVGYALMAASVPAGAIGSAQLAPGAVTPSSLATGAVAAALLAPLATLGVVTNGALSPWFVGGDTGLILLATNAVENAELWWQRTGTNGQTHRAFSGWDSEDPAGQFFVHAGRKHPLYGWAYDLIVSSPYQGDFALTYGNRVQPAGMHTFVGKGTAPTMHIHADTGTGYALTIGAFTNNFAGFSMNGLEWWTDLANTGEVSGRWYQRAIWPPGSMTLTQIVSTIEPDPGNFAGRQTVWWGLNTQPVVRIQSAGSNSSRALWYGTNVLMNLPVGFIHFGTFPDYPALNIGGRGATDGVAFFGVNRDSHPRLWVSGAGRLTWSPGTTWGDVSLGRSGENTLAVWGNLVVTGVVDGAASGLTPAAAQSLTGALVSAETVAATVAGATNATVLAAQLVEVGVLTGNVSAVSLLITNTFPGPGSVLTSDDGVHLYWKQP